MRCTACDRRISDEAVFCEHCGAEVVRDEPEPAGASGVGKPRPAPSAVLGGLLVVGSAFLPWLISADFRSTGLETPAAIVWDFLAEPGGVSLGVLLLVVGAVGTIFAVTPSTHLVRRVAGLVVVAVALLVAVQVRFYLDEVGLAGETLGILSAGVYAALVGGMLLLLAPRHAARS